MGSDPSVYLNEPFIPAARNAGTQLLLNCDSTAKPNMLTLLLERTLGFIGQVIQAMAEVDSLLAGHDRWSLTHAITYRNESSEAGNTAVVSATLSSPRANRAFSGNKSHQTFELAKSHTEVVTLNSWKTSVPVFCSVLFGNYASSELGSHESGTNDISRQIG